MSVRRGFTLLEVMIAIVITGIVALLAYGTAQAGFDTSDSVDRYRAKTEAQAVVRSLLTDALRHPVEGGGAAMNDVLFTIEDATNSEGLHVDRLRFLSNGIVPPLGASGTWIVTLEPTDKGLRFRAEPVAGGTAPSIETLLPDVHGLSARVLARSGDSTWSDRWDVVGRVPAAVALEFLSANGDLITAPLIVHASLEVVP